MRSMDDTIDRQYGGMAELITDEQKQRGQLIHALHELQQHEGYLSHESLERLAGRFSIPFAEVYSTATFYKMFHFKPRGKNIVSVCVGTACHVQGAAKVLRKITEDLGVAVGETSPDRNVTIETVGCIGCCGLAPVVIVNDDAVGNVGEKKLSAITERIRRNSDDS